MADVVAALPDRVTARWTDATRFVATTGNGATVEMDSAADDAATGPAELVLVALAGCSGLDVASILTKKRQPVATYEVVVSATARDAHPRIYTAITVDHIVEGTDVDMAAVRRCVELSATRYCRVNAMLSAGATEVTHRAIVRSGAGEESEVVVVTGPRSAGIVPQDAAGA